MDNERTSLLSRNMLRDQAYDQIREWIITGRLAPGTKITERVLADQLGVSRAPVKDALLSLKREGFVVAKPSGRYVKSFTREEVEQIYRVRMRLEPLAAELAAQNSSPAGTSILSAKIAEVEDACRNRDLRAFVNTDVEIHSLVWQQAQNPYLQSALDVIAAATFMLVPNCTRFVDDNWTVPLQEHRRIVESIAQGDAEAASAAMADHVHKGLQRSLLVVSGLESQ